jgi:hypothetical protein
MSPGAEAPAPPLSLALAIFFIVRRQTVEKIILLYRP